MGKLCDQELFSLETVAKMLEVSPRTVWRLVAEKLLDPPRSIGVGRHKRWFRAEVEICLLRLARGVEQKK